MSGKNDALDGYRAKPLDPDEKIAQTVEEIETTAAGLEPEPGTVVPTGDEEAPVASPNHGDALKTMFEKGRKNRELTQREDAEGSPDVALIQAMNAEAAGGGEVSEENQIDTNAPDRFDLENMSPEEYEEYLNEKAGIKKPATDPEIESESDATNALPAENDQTIVDVVVLGRKFQVPQQDIDDAGGLPAYQKNRSATIRLQRAATLETKALLKLSEVEEQQPGVQLDDPSSDGLSEADVDSLHGEMMDVVIDGSEEEVREWLSKKLHTPPQAPEKPKVTKPTESQELARPQQVTETQEELNRQFEAERVEANTMMKTDFPNIMADPELLQLAQQRFKVVYTDPNNEGRSQMEMVRESANYVASIADRLKTKPPLDPTEKERAQRVERKRSLPRVSQANQKAPSHEKQDRKVPSRKEYVAELRRRSGQDLTPS